jgi:DNA-binding MarR family transcriptional regulator
MRRTSPVPVDASAMDVMAKSRTQSTRPLTPLYARPGFMIRRAHQIAASLFSEEAGRLGVTTTQYGILWVLQGRDDLDQIGLAKLMGLDRSTTGLVVGKLESGGLLTRRSDAVDRRRKVLMLTDEGRAVLARLAAPAQRAQDRLLSAFTDAEAELFLGLLGKFIATFNHSIRTPIVADESPSPEAGPAERSPGKPGSPPSRAAKR